MEHYNVFVIPLPQITDLLNQLMKHLLLTFPFSITVLKAFILLETVLQSDYLI